MGGACEGWDEEKVELYRGRQKEKLVSDFEGLLFLLILKTKVNF